LTSSGRGPEGGKKEARAGGKKGSRESGYHDVPVRQRGERRESEEERGIEMEKGKRPDYTEGKGGEEEWEGGRRNGREYAGVEG